jgi:mannose-6-phosphate isomerase-like protein (cupin superfamily)
MNTHDPMNPNDPMNTYELSAFALRAAQDLSLWEPHVRFDRHRRYWARLPSPDDVDLWLLTWLPDQATELHDHGDSAAAVVVLSGRLTEVRARPDGHLSSSVLVRGGAYGLPVGTIHDVVNVGPEPAVSVHAYSPRLTQMTFYATGEGWLRPVRTTVADDEAAVPA